MNKSLGTALTVKEDQTAPKIDTGHGNVQLT